MFARSYVAALKDETNHKPTAPVHLHRGGRTFISMPILPYNKGRIIRCWRGHECRVTGYERVPANRLHDK